MTTSKQFNIVILMTLMSLVSCTNQEKPAAASDIPSGHESMIMLSEREKMLANIIVDTVQIKPLAEISTFTGTVAIDENALITITSRARGRIEKLYVRNPGEYISENAPLYDLYSEELLSDEQEYLAALAYLRAAETQKEFAKTLADAARNKLLLWTLSKEQIEALEQSGRASAYSTFFSHQSGYVTDLPVREGQYVETGSPIMKLSNLHTVWVEVQIYTSELSSLQGDPHLTIETEALPGKQFIGEIAFDNPFLEENKKINLVRIKVDNSTGKLKPGMMAYVYSKRNERKTLVIQKSSLLIENAISVWVQMPDGMYEQRMVTTGIENKHEVEILSGLKPGELVVTSGAYLLKSAQVVRQGGNSMEGMQM
jgi:membrane fusion protein, copper/silver efflux system